MPSQASVVLEIKMGAEKLTQKHPIESMSTCIYPIPFDTNSGGHLEKGKNK